MPLYKKVQVYIWFLKPDLILKSNLLIKNLRISGIVNDF